MKNKYFDVFIKMNLIYNIFKIILKIIINK